MFFVFLPLVLSSQGRRIIIIIIIIIIFLTLLLPLCESICGRVVKYTIDVCLFARASCSFSTADSFIYFLPQFVQVCADFRRHNGGRSFAPSQQKCHYSNRLQRAVFRHFNSNLMYTPAVVYQQPELCNLHCRTLDEGGADQRRLLYHCYYSLTLQFLACVLFFC